MITNNVVFIGDSITLATHLVDTYHYTGYVQRLQANLPQSYPGINWNIYNEGVNATATKDWVNWIGSKVNAHNPNLVVIMLGTNDAALTPELEGYTSLPNFETYYRSIINQIRVYNNADIIMITPPPVDETIRGTIRTNANTSLYAQKVRQLAAEFQIPLVDVWNDIYKFYPSMTFTDSFFDGLHLSDAGHLRVFNIVRPVILKTLDLANSLLKVGPTEGSSLQLPFSVTEMSVLRMYVQKEKRNITLTDITDPNASNIHICISADPKVIKAISKM